MISLRNSTESRRPDSCNRCLDVLSRWLKTKSQIKFIFSDLMFLYMCQWSSGMITWEWLWWPGFDSWQGQFFEISNFNSFDIFTCSGVYIHTFGLKLSQPLWLSGSVSVSWAHGQEFNSCQSQNVLRGPLGILGIADLIGAVWRDQGPGGGWGQDDCRLSSGLHCHVICSRDA